MLCPLCERENPIGAVYCAECGFKLEMTDSSARLESIDESRQDKWQRACLALNRTLYVCFLVFVASILFNAYATREIKDDFTPSALPPPPHALEFADAVVSQPELPLPSVPSPAPIPPEKPSEAEILSGLATKACEQLNCNIFLKTGGTVKGVMALRTKDEVHVITEWTTPPKVRVIKTSNIDFVRSKLPR